MILIFKEKLRYEKCTIGNVLESLNTLFAHFLSLIHDCSALRCPHRSGPKAFDELKKAQMGPNSINVFMAQK